MCVLCRINSVLKRVNIHRIYRKIQKKYEGRHVYDEF
jgi:hypothetical protein